MNWKGVWVGFVHLVLILIAVCVLLWLFPPQKADYSNLSEEGKSSFIMRDSCVSLSQAAMSRGRIKYLQERGASAGEFDSYFDALDSFYTKWCGQVLPISKAVPSPKDD